MVASGVRNSCEVMATKRDLSSFNSLSFSRARSISSSARLRSVTSTLIQIAPRARSPGSTALPVTSHQKREPSLRFISRSVT
ncbi:hypothetical protein D3C83_17560 [compost metagenome]